MKVKMCGLYRPEDIDYANEVQPDYVGFVFYPKSHRVVTKEQAAEYISDNLTMLMKRRNTSQTIFLIK